MKLSETTTELFNGMYLLKGTLEQPKFNAKVSYALKNGQKKEFQYADLSAVENAIRTAAQKSKSGIDFQQEVINASGQVSVTTLITHISGEYIIHGPLNFSAGNNSPQDIGSLISYAKRYSLSAAFGISAENDDDGQLAADSQTNKNSSQQDEYISSDKVKYLQDLGLKVANLADTNGNQLVGRLKVELKNTKDFDKYTEEEFSNAVRKLDEWKKACQNRQQPSQNNFNTYQNQNMTWGMN